MQESWRDRLGCVSALLIGVVVFLWFLIGAIMSLRAYFSQEYWVGVSEPSFYLTNGVLGLLVVIFGIIILKVGRHRLTIAYGLFMVAAALLFLINAYISAPGRPDLFTLGWAAFLIPTVLGLICFLAAVAGK